MKIKSKNIGVYFLLFMLVVLVIYVLMSLHSKQENENKINAEKEQKIDHFFRNFGANSECPYINFLDLMKITDGDIDFCSNVDISDIFMFRLSDFKQDELSGTLISRYSISPITKIKIHMIRGVEVPFDFRGYYIVGHILYKSSINYKGGCELGFGECLLFNESDILSTPQTIIDKIHEIK